MTRKGNASLAWTNLLFVLVCLPAACYAPQERVHRDVSTDKEECPVEDRKEVCCPIAGKLLAFVTPEQSLTFHVTFKDRDKDDDRDKLMISNCEATHVKVRKEGNSTTEHHILPILISEGWNIFKFFVGESNFTLAWIPEEEPVSLFNLTMDYSIKNTFLLGNASVCSGVSPEWQVREGDQVFIPLDPQRKVQHLEVTGNGTSEAYLKVPDNTPELPVPANTSLTLNTTQNSSGTFVEVFQENKEATLIEQSSRSRPVVVMGGRHGSTLFRLKREVTTTTTTTPPPSTSSPFFISTIVLAVLLVISCVAHLPPVRRLVTTTTTTQEEHWTTHDSESDDEGMSFAVLSPGTTGWQGS